jgi:hypothetical protein
MDSHEQLSPFDAAFVAFEIRFERELTSRWEDLEYEAAQCARASSGKEKRSALNGFFEDANNAIASVIHEYFPRLLQVATTQRQYLGRESPLSWTQSQVLRQVCNFLGVDEQFDHTSAPKDDSRLVAATARIALGTGWPDESIPSDFVLPSWLHDKYSLALLFSQHPEDHAGQVHPLSRAETLDWIKQREFWMSKRLARQIDNDSWDGIIAAGKSNVSVLDAFDAVDQPRDGVESTPGVTELHGHSFVRETSTWAISFGDETCSVKMMVGLVYIAVLLQNPGRAIRALGLQALAGGRSADSRFRRVDGLPEDGVLRKKSEDQEDLSSHQDGFVPQEILDDQARRQLTQRSLQIEGEITYRTEIGDVQAVDKLEKEHFAIESQLKGARNVHNRPRVFSDDNEKARTSVTHALERAYESIRQQAPKTAAHLKSNIIRGSAFTYRDASTSWNVRS